MNPEKQISHSVAMRQGLSLYREVIRGYTVPQSPGADAVEELIPICLSVNHTACTGDRILKDAHGAYDTFQRNEGPNRMTFRVLS